MFLASGERTEVVLDDIRFDFWFPKTYFDSFLTFFFFAKTNDKKELLFAVIIFILEMGFILVLLSLKCLNENCFTFQEQLNKSHNL